MSGAGGWPVAFEKYSGAGNDFILIDIRQTGPPSDPQRLARSLCRRGHSVGADGLILLDRPGEEDPAGTAVRIRLWNADGSAAEISGNGARCVARWVVDHEDVSSDEEILIASDVGPLRARVDRDTTRMRMPMDALVWPGRRLRVEGRDLSGTYVEVGVPFFVCFHEQPEGLPVRYLGRAIREHPELAPRGANVDFVRVEEEQRLFFRVYERGVEDETLSSGTGSIAAALAAAAADRVVSPVTCVAPGSSLTVRFRRERPEEERAGPRKMPVPTTILDEIAAGAPADSTASDAEHGTTDGVGEGASDDPTEREPTGSAEAVHAVGPDGEDAPLFPLEEAVRFDEIEMEGDARRIFEGRAFAGAARPAS